MLAGLFLGSGFCYPESMTLAAEQQKNTDYTNDDLN